MPQPGVRADPEAPFSIQCDRVDRLGRVQLRYRLRHEALAVETQQSVGRGHPNDAVQILHERIHVRGSRAAVGSETPALLAPLSYDLRSRHKPTDVTFFLQNHA
jgi:hypothetical protein